MCDVTLLYQDLGEMVKSKWHVLGTVPGYAVRWKMDVKAEKKKNETVTHARSFVGETPLSFGVAFSLEFVTNV